jgi:hypothetical protein
MHTTNNHNIVNYQQSPQFLRHALGIINQNLPKYHNSLEELRNSCQRILDNVTITYFPIPQADGSVKRGMKRVYMFNRLTPMGFRNNNDGIDIQTAVDVITAFLTIKQRKMHKQPPMADL